jgi:hypothetical protein
MHCIVIRYFLLELLIIIFPWKVFLSTLALRSDISSLETIVNNDVSSLGELFKQQYQILLPTWKKLFPLWSLNKKILWLPQMFAAFRKRKCYIYDVFITVNDDALDILLDVSLLCEQLCWFSF